MSHERGEEQSAVDVRAPKTLEELGVPEALIHDLVLRQALVEGRTSTVRLSNKLCLGPTLLTTVVEDLRALRYLEVQGLEGRDYLLALTEAGREHANDRMKLCRYTGPAPVGLAQYSAVVRAQHAEPTIDLLAMKQAFSDLVIADGLLRQLGPAAISKGAMFLYGPPGTGKSSIAERLLRIHQDRVLIPYAVEVDGQIISVFDPVIHKPVDGQPEDIDRRFVLCQRPCIIVGGELVGSMLDLSYQSGSGIYLAPLQMQANNGILVIDDFGRQSLTPEQLLNRWIVPLDRSIDYLSLDYGMKFEIPFDAKIVFSTNLAPETLGDEAFFRRIKSKILIPTIDDEQFDEVLRRVTTAKGITCSPGAPAHLRKISRELGDGDLRPYLPAAACEILTSICRFDHLPVVLDEDTINRVACVYFTNAAEAIGELPPPTVSKWAQLETAETIDAPVASAPAPAPVAAPTPAPTPDRALEPAAVATISPAPGTAAWQSPSTATAPTATTGAFARFAADAAATDEGLAPLKELTAF